MTQRNRAHLGDTSRRGSPRALALVPLLVALAVAIGVLGCTGRDSGTSLAGPTPKSTVSPSTAGPGRTTTTTRTTPSVIEKWAVWGEAVTIEGVARMTVEAPLPDRRATPVSIPGFAGQTVVYSLITIQNIGRTAIVYDARWFELRAEGESWGGGYEGLTTSVGPLLGSGSLGPGDSVRGAVAFQLTAAGVATIREIVYQSRPSPSSIVIHWVPELPRQYSSLAAGDGYRP